MVGAIKIQTGTVIIRAAEISTTTTTESKHSTEAGTLAIVANLTTEMSIATNKILAAAMVVILIEAACMADLTMRAETEALMISRTMIVVTMLAGAVTAIAATISTTAIEVITTGAMTMTRIAVLNKIVAMAATNNMIVSATTAIMISTETKTLAALNPVLSKTNIAAAPSTTVALPA